MTQTRTVEHQTAPAETKVGFPKITTVVRADRAMLAGLFTSDENTRYYLQGVLIHTIADKTVNIVATNGHILGVFNDERGFCHEADSFIVKIPKEAVAIIKKETTRGFEGWLVIHEGGAHRVAHVVRSSYDIEEISDCVSSLNTVWTGKVEIIDGLFPNYQSVIPQALDNAGVPVIQTKYLNIFHAVGKAQLNTGTSTSAIQLFSKNTDSPILVGVHGRADFVGVVMPMRIYEGFKIPSFAENLPSKAEKRKAKSKAYRSAKEMEAV